MSVVESTRACWSDVEQELERLARSGAAFATSLSPTNKIGSYDPGRRVGLENARGTSWIEIESIEACWAKLEQLGEIRRRDVLEPGRCSAFMMALFARIPGVVVDDERDEPYLVLQR